MHRSTRCFALALFAISSLTAQRVGSPIGGTGNPGIGTGGVGTNPGGNIGTGGTQTQPSTSTNSSPFPQDNRTPIFLSGRVLMDDGTPPPTSIAIQRVCSGSPRTVAFTSGKGLFSFQWGVTAGILPDASESTAGNGRLGGANLGRGGQLGMGNPMMGCELIANAPGFRSDRVSLTSRRADDNPDVGTIVLHRIAGVEGTSVSATSLNAPKDAKKAWEKGDQLLQKSKFAEAEKELDKAVAIYPRYANAWLDLGRARMQQHADGPAHDAFLKAIDADDKLVEPYLELGQIAVNRKNWPDAARYFDRVLELDPVDYPALWFEDAVADYNAQKFDHAERSAKEALKLPPANVDPHAYQLLGILLYNKQDYAGAGEALRSYVKLSPNATDLDQVKTQLDQIDRQLAATKP